MCLFLFYRFKMKRSISCVSYFFSWCKSLSGWPFLSIYIMNRDIVPAMPLLLIIMFDCCFSGISSNPTTWVLPFTCGIKSTGSSLHVGSSSKPFALFFQYIMLYECLFIFFFSLYQLERCLSLGQISTYLLHLKWDNLPVQQMTFV